ncbi:hypothetical protein D8Y22_10250 [Salinadaptatus halalkaliphilus]|uniref:Uncharacterized protein n=1 Tax=Salinadaptatus halalkaliphilus TaxID=2419781 RepID=A0A4S3TP99_9EURY|nr:hypothetical protein [Salinadaptatus halalkaliphilus]THE64985.1 hypothetical protein D8Y22_10250 [Salinadaptatus halalkaliphilus]
MTASDAARASASIQTYGLGNRASVGVGVGPDGRVRIVEPSDESGGAPALEGRRRGGEILDGIDSTRSVFAQGIAVGRKHIVTVVDTVADRRYSVESRHCPVRRPEGVCRVRDGCVRPGEWFESNLVEVVVQFAREESSAGFVSGRVP